MPEQFSAPVERFFVSGKRLIPAQAGIYLVLILMLAGQAFADTTWVSGAVSGEWTREGNPYIVIDSTWVPAGERLTLTASVEAFFDEGQGLYVFGTMNAEGEERDSVRIRVSEGVEHWKGIRYIGRDRTQWNYASVVCPDTAIVLGEGFYLEMNHCTIYALRTSFSSTIRSGARGWNLEFSWSDIRGVEEIRITGGLVTAVDTRFDFNSGPGFYGDGTGYQFSNCEVIGSLSLFAGYSIVDNCRFFKHPDIDRINVSITGSQGRMQNSYVEGGVGLSFSGDRSIIFYKNELLGGLSASLTSAEILDCDIKGRIYLSECKSIRFRNSILSRSAVVFSAEELTFDSCQLVYSDPIRNRFSIIADSTPLTIRRSVIRTEMTLWTSGEILLDHNTIIFDSSGLNAISTGRNSIYTNNIIMTSVHGSNLFSNDQLPVFEYNCVDGFTYAAGSFDHMIQIEEIDSSNMISYPRIIFEDDIPKLAWNSPCIDRGDPNFENDPDGTRSDIGAYSFDHRLGMVNSDKENTGTSHFASAEVFPNPFNNYLNISIKPSNNLVTLTLLDPTGRIIPIEWGRPLPFGEGIVSLNSAALPTGNYFILIQSKETTKAISVLLLR